MNPLIAYFQLFQSIPEQDQEVIAAHFERKTYREGDLLTTGGKVCHEMFFVCTGVLRILNTTEKGIEVTHFFCKENQFCTILQSFMEETPAEASIQAACDAEVLAITKSRLLALYQQLPYVKEWIETHHQQRLMEKVRIRNTYLGEDAESQYKLFIMQQPDVALRVPLKYIASYLGITPQSLSRIRKNITEK